MVSFTQIAIFVTLAILSFIVERQTHSGCRETWLTLLISLLHNFGTIYLVFGSLIFGYYTLHLVTLFIVVALWKLYDVCIVTTYYNKLCGIYLERPFHDIFFAMNQQLEIPYFRYLLVLLVSIYDIKQIIDKY